MCFTSTLFAQKPSADGYQIKAVFLYNFTQFIEFPNNSFSSNNSPFIIGIYGKDPFGSYLQEVIEGEQSNGHPIVIQYYNSIEEIQNCHILFLPKSESENLQTILMNVSGRNILTVSDAPDFLNQEGMIAFFNRNNKIQIGVNLKSVKSTKLIISSKLLRVVEIFNQPK